MDHICRIKFSERPTYVGVDVVNNVVIGQIVRRSPKLRSSKLDTNPLWRHTVATCDIYSAEDYFS